MIVHDIWLAFGAGLVIGFGVYPMVMSVTLLEFLRVQRRVNGDDSIDRVVTLRDFRGFAEQSVDWQFVTGLTLKAIPVAFLFVWLLIFVVRGLLNHPYWA